MRASRLSRRELLQLSAGGTIATFLAACVPATGGQPGTGATQEKLTITYWDWWNMSTGPSGQMFDFLPEGFAEVQPDLELNLQNVPFGEYFRKFLAAHAAGDVPDVMHCSVSWARDFFDRGALTDLTSYIDVTPSMAREQFFDGALRPTTKGAVQYGVPGEGPDHQTIFFNVDYFEEEGLPTDLNELATWQWDNLTEAATALTRKDDSGQVTRSGFLVTVPNMHTLAIWAACHGGSLYHEDGGQVTGMAFNENDAAIRGFSWWLDLLANVSQPITAERQDWNQFLQGATAMVQSGPWNFSQVREQAPDMNWSAMLYPAAPVDGGKYSTDIWTNMQVIPNKAQNKDAGWDFITYWCGLDFMLKRLEFGLWMAPRKDFYETEEYAAARSDLPVLDNVPLAQEVGTPHAYIQRTALDETVIPIAEAVMLGDRDAASAVDEMIEKSNEILVKAGYGAA